MVPMTTQAEIIQPTTENMADETDVQKFYNGGHILITGGTGFLGKVLLEKLLRSCPGIEKIYLLIRCKKGVEPASRLETLTSDVLFDRLRILKPNFAEKLQVVPGDCSEPFLGISSELYETLLEKVNIVFHSAANIKLQDKLKKAAAINILGTERILEFCRRLKDLKSVVCVSTAYSYYFLNKIEDQFYDPPLYHDRIGKLSELLTEEEMDILTPHFLEKWPNTYLLTKAVAEAKVRSSGGDLPISIFRPALVTPSYAEPVPGYTDNFNGPTGLFLQLSLGTMKTLLINENNQGNMVPVDLTANALILVAKGTNDLHNIQPGDIKIFGFGSNLCNPTLIEMTNFVAYWNKFFPSIHAVGIQSVIFTKSKTLYRILRTIYETFPAHFIDLFLTATGKKPRMTKLYKLSHELIDTVGYFTLNVLNYEMKNFEVLFERCTEEDKTIFYSDLKQIDWKEYFKKYLIGMRKYLLKESDDTIEKAKVRQRILFWTFVASRILFSTILIWMLNALRKRMNLRQVSQLIRDLSKRIALR